MLNTEMMMTGMLFFQLLCSVGIIALSLYAFNETSKLHAQFLVDLNVFTFNMIFCYVYCYYSERVTERAFGIADIAYDTRWHELPPNEQKVFVLMIVRGHKEFRMTGLGIIDCSLAQFLAVMRIFWIFISQQPIWTILHYLLADLAECGFVFLDTAAFQIKILFLCILDKFWRHGFCLLRKAPVIQCIWPWAFQ